MYNNTETCKQKSEGQSQIILFPKSNIIKSKSLEIINRQITIQNFGGFNYTHSGYFMRHRMHDLKTTKFSKFEHSKLTIYFAFILIEAEFSILVSSHSIATNTGRRLLIVKGKHEADV